MTASTTTVTPVKGMVWVHAKRTHYDGSPKTYTVSSINRKTTTVYSKDKWGEQIKTPLATFERFVSEVVSVPAPPEPAQRMSAQQCEVLHARAFAAGEAAAEALVPNPMIVGSPSTPLGSDVDPSQPTWYVAEGVCGFAWVGFRGDTDFGRWARRKGIARKAFEGGLHLWVSRYGQSMERKAAFAEAYAAVLREAGVKASAGSRMD